jgi:hypothetical protein
VDDNVSYCESLLKILPALAPPIPHAFNISFASTRESIRGVRDWRLGVRDRAEDGQT